MEEKEDSKVVPVLNRIAVLIAIVFTVITIADGRTYNSSALINILVLIRFYVIYLIVKDGGILRNKVYSTFAIISGLLIAIGIPFYIMHWPYARVILLSGFVIAAIFYTVRFVLKKEKHLLDYMKWAWIFSSGIFYPIVLNHVYSEYNLVQIPSVFFLAIMLVYLRDMIQPQETESR